MAPQEQEEELREVTPQEQEEELLEITPQEQEEELRETTYPEQVRAPDRAQELGRCRHSSQFATSLNLPGTLTL
jgi:hypothetical protein